MVTDALQKKPMDKEAILAAVRAELEQHEGGRVSLRKFLAVSGMKEGELMRYHTGWNELLREAGCDREQPNMRVDPMRLLADWGGVVRKLKRVPSWNEYRVHGEYNETTFVQYFGAWSKVPWKFRQFAARRATWKDVVALLPPSRRVICGRSHERKTERRALRRIRVPRMTGRPVCGKMLGIGGFNHAPVNEPGVVLLFGVLAERLGFQVESVQTAFPDCEAKRRVCFASHRYGDVPEMWQNVRIEFEFESRNFRDHKHPPEGCGIIVCWVHNWADCPKNLEVIALSEEIAKMERDGGK